MAIMQLTTKAARQVWASPDGQRKIYELEMEFEGKPVKAKTYSDAIATVGWSGQAETYEKTGRNGIETFVKQPPKEGGSYGAQSPSGGYRGGAGKVLQDPFTMYLSYAKDLTVAMIQTGTVAPKTTYQDLLDQTIAGAYTLYQGRPEAKEIVKEVTTTTPDVIHEVTDGPVDLSAVDRVFNTDPETEEELPWDKIKG